MSGTKVVAQKTFYPQIRKMQKYIESPAGGISASDMSPLEHDSELFEPSKDS